LYRGGLTLYGVHRFDEAAEIYQILKARFPESAAGKHELDRTAIRIKEQKTGVYDWKKLYKASALRPPRMDCASFSGPIEIRDSPGRGRRLFTTKQVQAVDILLCEKAFLYCFAAAPGELLKAKSISPASVLLDVPGNQISFGTHTDIIRYVSNKSIMAPSPRASVETLFYGSYGSVPSIPVNGGEVVDT
jgi:hypothetical protein